MKHDMLIPAVAAAILLQGCSSRPRTFAPTLAALPSGAPAFDQAAFDRAYADCTQLLVAGKLDNSGRLASAGAGAAAGTAAAVAGGALASSMVPAVGMAVASATIVLLPFVAIGSAVGMSKMKRAKKEKAIKTKMAGCLAQRGYVVGTWVKAKKPV
jgi:hypothetical protein